MPGWQHPLTGLGVPLIRGGVALSVPWAWGPSKATANTGCVAAGGFQQPTNPFLQLAGCPCCPEQQQLAARVLVPALPVLPLGQEAEATLQCHCDTLPWVSPTPVPAL